MTKKPKELTKRENLILRDYLAVDRTILSNERTFLAFVRTALTVFAIGISLVKLFETSFLHYMGYACIPVAFVVFILGLQKYRKGEQLIHLTEK